MKTSEQRSERPIRRTEFLLDSKLHVFYGIHSQRFDELQIKRKKDGQDTQWVLNMTRGCDGIRKDWMFPANHTW